MSVHAANERTYDDRGRWRTSTYAHAGEAGSADETLYIKGDEFTDGSIRLIFSHDDITTLEKRSTGVWNSTEFEISSQTLLLGHNLSISAIGNSAQVNSVIGGGSFLLTDIPFNDDGAIQPQTVLADKRVNRNIFQPDNSSESLSISHLLVVFAPAIEGFVFNIYIQVGTTAPVNDVRVVISLGTTLGGAKVFEHDYPASDFVVNTEIILSMEGGIGILKGESIVVNIFSPSAFALKGNVGAEMWFAADVQKTVREDMVMDSAIFTVGIDHILDNVIDPVYANPVFS